ncbi:hypothetical protein KR054_003113 [Drosophila jambulina]|nr:hypothetical protein KR054_003113 [Drosophila jambulina]
MFEFRRQLCVPKLSAVILRWMFNIARFLGIFCFKFKTTTDGQVAEESGPRLKWSLFVFRLGCMGISTCAYFAWNTTLSDTIQQFLHILFMLISVACGLYLLRLPLVHRTSFTYLAERFLQLFLKVQNVCNRKQKGFGKTHELTVLTLTLVCLAYEGSFLTRLYILKGTAKDTYVWIADFFVSLGCSLLMHIATVGYLTLGLLYADLNDYVRTKLRSQLESLEEHPTRRKLRKARKTLDTCLTLYEDVQSVTSLFQRLYNLPLLLGLGRNCVGLALISYSTFIYGELGLCWHWSKVSIEILTLLLLTLSVQRAKLQFKTIRSLMLENFHLSENKEWHTTLEVFFTHLNLHEFQVRPLGLFIISNELMLTFLSGLVTYITVIVQYRMQMEVLTLSLSKRLS